MLQAQSKNSVPGNYSLQGVREMASGILLKPDNTFEFFFVYGIMDRNGTGTWKKEGDNVVLNSRPYPGSDFKLTAVSKTEDPLTTVTITANDPLMCRYTYCYAKIKDSTLQLNFNEQDIIQFRGRPVDSLKMAFEFVGRVSAFPIKDASANNYTFSYEPWLFEVFFTNFTLRITDKGLEGRHPLLDKEEYVFKKEEQ